MALDVCLQLEHEQNEVEKLVGICFSPSKEEQFIVHCASNSTDFISELNYIAKQEDLIVGKITYMKGKIVDDLGKEHEVIGFGPICVHPDFRHKGIATKMLVHSLAVARHLGYQQVVILGNPNFYGRYGFRHFDTIVLPNGESPEALLTLALTNKPIYEGVWYYSDVYTVDQTKMESYYKEGA